MNDKPQATSLAPIEDRIAARIDAGTLQGLSVSSAAGGLAFSTMDQVMEFAKTMAVSQIAVRKHLRGNPGACAAVIMQAIEWRMSPYAVANKSYAVNDQLAYEAQLIHAVILQRAPIHGRIKAEYSGTDGKRVLRVWAVLKDGEEVVDYTSPLFEKIQPKNSPLWKNDPDQQLFYYSVRALARRHFPDVILGVYADDELPQSQHVGPDNAKNVTPHRDRLGARLDQIALDDRPASAGGDTPHDAVTGEVIEPKARRAAAARTATKAAETKPEEIEEAETVADPGEGNDDFPGDRPMVQDFVDEVNREVDEADEDSREQSPVDLAYDAGWKACKDGMSRKAIPPALRGTERVAEQTAWHAGFDEAAAQG